MTDSSQCRELYGQTGNVRKFDPNIINIRFPKRLNVLTQMNTLLRILLTKKSGAMHTGEEAVSRCCINMHLMACRVCSPVL